MNTNLDAIRERDSRIGYLENELKKPYELGRLDHLNELATLRMWQERDNSVILTDRAGRKWHILEREDGSIAIYWTREGDPAHYIVFDTLDSET